MNRTAWTLVVAVAIVSAGCAKKEEKVETAAEEPATNGLSMGLVPVETLKSYPVSNLDGVLTETGVVFDSTSSADGDGSIKITATAPTTVRLFETGDLDVENARIIYRARLRTEDVEGKVFLEMWCTFPGRGEFFSRALDVPLSGTTAWTNQETPFFLKAGENPDNIKLNLVIDGKGMAWIDDVTIVKGPLGQQN